MAYNQFKKLEQLRKQFQLVDILEFWLPNNIPQILPSSKLMEALEVASAEHLGTEKAKSEYIIVPILNELKRNNPNRFSSFSGYEFEVDKSLGLTGFCDYLFSASSKRGEITAPIFCLVEAKNDNVEKGWAQCGAEMYAVRLYNAKEGNPREVVYGCVSTGFLWCFLKLAGNNLYISPDYIPLTFSDPQKVLSVFQWILAEALNV